MPGIDFKQNQIVVAMDHARYFGLIDGLHDPGAVIDAVAEAGADAIMTTFGVVKTHGERLTGRIPTILRLDGGTSQYRDAWRGATEWSLLHSVEDARALGVDAVCLMYFMGSEVEMDTLEIVASVASECLEDGLPVMVEALPCPHPRLPHPDTPGPMADACRIAFEHGADVLKTYYTGSADGFRRVTEGCPAPVLIAGGPRMDTEHEMLEVVHGAVTAGAKGVVFGRNIWQSANPAAIVRALGHIIHEGGSPAEVAELVQG